MANACCSIELEPRTLRQGQLIHAREIAADVVQKMERDEASTPQIKEVRLAKEMDQIEENGNREDEQKHDDDDHNCYKEKGEVLESPCQCSVITSNMESPDDRMIIKEPLSAPF